MCDETAWKVQIQALSGVAECQVAAIGLDPPAVCRARTSVVLGAQTAFAWPEGVTLA